MRLVSGSRIRTDLALFALASALLAASPLQADARRVMVLESIHVAPDEVLEQTTCIGCSIHVEGVVNDSALLLLGRLHNEGEIKGNAVVLGGSVMSSGPIGGSALVVGGTLRLEDDMDGNAVTVMGDLEVGANDVRIGGDAWTVLGQQNGVTSGSVAGSITRLDTPSIGRMLVSGLVGGLLLLGLLALGIVLTLSLLGYVLLGVQRLTVMADACTQTPAACFLVGLGTCFGLTVIGLMMSMLLPVSLPMVLLFPIVSVIGYCGLAFAIGRNLLPSTRPLLATVCGGVLVAAVQLVPIVGWLVLVVLWNVALGAAIMSGFGISSDWLSAKAAGQFAH